MPDAIVLNRVSKSFGTKKAVRDLCLTVPEGALYGFIGPNGAGKTTTIRMIMSILLPDEGSVRVLGRQSALDAKDRTGYLPEERGLYKKMRVGAFLRYMAKLKGYRGSDLGRRVSEWLEKVALADVEKKRCEELSKGMQQKLQFVAAVLHEPELLILDEPFSGLDPINMRLLRDLIEEQHRRGASVIFSTHVMVHAEQICDHVVMIDDGTKVLDQSLTDIRRNYDPRTISFEPLDPSVNGSVLEGLPGVEKVMREDGHFEIALRDGTDVAATMSAIASALPTARLEVHRPTLEEVFIQIVGRGTSSGNAE